MDNKKDTQAAGERKPLLELNLAPVRPFITIDDVKHDLRLMQDMGSIEHQEFSRDSRRYDELYELGRTERKLTKAEQKEMDDLLERLLPQTLVDPGRLLEQTNGQLTGTMKREILITFTNAPLLTAMALQNAETETEETRSTTAS